MLRVGQALFAALIEELRRARSPVDDARVPTRSPRAYAILAAFPLTAWSLFHLWEQWAVFDGRQAWIDRAGATSRGPIAIAIESVVIASLLAWAVLGGRARLARTAIGASAPEASFGERVIAILGRAGAPIALAFLAIHVGHFWIPKVVEGATAIETWSRMTHELGQPWMIVLYAIGASAVAFHLAAALPRALEALGWIANEPRRRAAMLASCALALVIWVLSIQLVGWLATGTGLLWRIDVVEEAQE
jgi:succinate dehydrogenase/fumarate reductase cytochrome b subunit